MEIISDVSFQRPSQMPFSEHDHMIQALSANAADEAFRERILPRTPCRREYLYYSHSLNSSSKLATVYSITVSDEISRRRIIWKRFDDLLRRPFCGGMVRHVEMQHAPTLMRQNHEDKQHSQLQCRNSEEVDRDQLTDMVGQKRLPRLRRWRAPLWHQA